MDFSYSISLAQAKEAFWLLFWNVRRKITMSVFSLLILADIVLIGLLIIGDRSVGARLDESIGSDAISTLLIVLGIFLFVLGYVLVVVPWIYLRPTRKNPAMLAHRTVTLTSERFESQSEAGSSSVKWMVFRYWREGKTVIALRLISNQYQILSKQGLSFAELEELRRILSAALPQKR